MGLSLHFRHFSHVDIWRNCSFDKIVNDIDPVSTQSQTHFNPISSNMSKHGFVNHFNPHFGSRSGTEKTTMPALISEKRNENDINPICGAWATSTRFQIVNSMQTQIHVVKHMLEICQHSNVHPLVSYCRAGLAGGQPNVAQV